MGAAGALNLSRRRPSRWMHYLDLSPTQAALLDTAAGDALLPLMQDMLDQRLDPHVLIESRPPRWFLLVLGLRGDEVISEVELSVRWASTTERVRLTVLSLHVDQLLARAEKWRRGFDRRVA